MRFRIDVGGFATSSGGRILASPRRRGHVVVRVASVFFRFGIIHVENCVKSVSWCEFSGNAARHGSVTRGRDTYILGQTGPQPYVT